MSTQLIGRSLAMKSIFKQIGLAAKCNFPVLIQGESGTGKQLAAELIHQKSFCANGPFVDVNTALLPDDTLLHSVLFGHEKGSFTGAIARQKGKFEEANQGTLFLDEIGDMHQGCQAKILKVLESNKIQRLGGKTQVDVEVRLIFATNRNLKNLSEEGKFRKDLLYRLDVFQINLPPLKERKEDIPLLVDNFLEKIGYPSGISPDALSFLSKMDYAGNVRELENLLKKGSIYAQGNLIEIPHLIGEIK